MSGIVLEAGPLSMHKGCSPPFLAKLILHIFSGMEQEIITVDTERTNELFDGNNTTFGANRLRLCRSVAPAKVHW